MHQQVVGFVVFQTDFVGNAGGHRYGGNSRGTDKRIDFGFAETVHQFRQKHTRSRGYGERDNPQYQDTQGFRGQEFIRLQFGAYGQSQQNGNNVAKFVLQGFG